MADIKKPLMGMSLYELKEVAKSLGMPAFTGGQMAKWLYTQHVKSIDEMTNISKTNRERLAEEYTIGCMEPIDCQVSKDGTIKYLFPLLRANMWKLCTSPITTALRCAFRHKWVVK